MNCECGCCSGVHVALPAARRNAPAQAEISHRPGDWASFLQALQANLSNARFPELGALTTRARDDATLALCDAWSVAAEVLSFYQDRIANEGYLRTATERRSLIELGRLTGYAPRPGVSASVYLAYTLDANAGRVTIPRGTRAQSVPEAGETMQTFETADALAARAEWSRITVRLSQPVWRSSSDDDLRYGVPARGLTLAGTATRLALNDPLLVDFGGTVPKAYRIIGLEPDETAQTTYVRLAPWHESSQARAARAATLAAASIAAGTIAAGPLNGRSLYRAITATRTPPRAAPPVTKELQLRAGGDLFARLLAHQSPTLRDMLVPALRSFDARGSDLKPIAVYALRASAAVFGSAAPATVMTQPPNADGIPAFGRLTIELAWADLPQIRDLPANANEVNLSELPLDGVFDAVKPDTPTQRSWVLIDAPEVQMPAEPPPPGLVESVAPSVVTGRIFTTVARVLESRTASLSIGAALSAKSTQLSVEPVWYDLERRLLTSEFGVPLLRGTRVHAQCEALALARDPLKEPVEESGEGELELELDGYYDGLLPGMGLIAGGERADIPDAKARVPAAERVEIAAVRHDVLRYRRGTTSTTGANGPPDGAAFPNDTLHTFVRLRQPLKYSYRRPSFVLHGNVVRATHGETRREVLGAGDATQSGQRFTLKSPPLTFVAAATETGVASTLRVRVNRLLWHETVDIAANAADARVYTTSRSDAEVTSLEFGDGVHGARLPTGADNVAAEYRSGLGAAGNVRAAQISLPTDKPLGVSGVINPLRASGGARADSIRQARENLPIAAIALDRLVSVSDYADFARDYAGIGKAASTALRINGRERVFLTIAGVDDEPIDETSDLYVNLDLALRRFGAAQQPFRIGVRRALFLVIRATIAIDPDYEWADVSARVRAALLDAFGFEAAAFARRVSASRVIATIEAVRGVVHLTAFDLDALDDDDLIDNLVATADPPAPPPPPTPLAGANPEGTAATGVSVVNVSAVRVSRDHIDAEGAVVAADGRTVLPAQIAYLPADVPDTLFLEQAP